MADIAFIAITIAFFVLCAGVVRLCDRVIGPDSDHVLVDDEHVDATDAEPVGAAR
ncbi:MAG: hypothetical protein JO291_01230 [Acidimicrobiia bacterium]|nr:hypothetical protein [Acidimicrobiia bacterium]